MRGVREGAKFFHKIIYHKPLLFSLFNSMPFSSRISFQFIYFNIISKYEEIDNFNLIPSFWISGEFKLLSHCFPRSFNDILAPKKNHISHSQQSSLFISWLFMFIFLIFFNLWVLLITELVVVGGFFFFFFFFWGGLFSHRGN